MVMGQGICLWGGDVVTTCGLCKPPTSPAFLSTTLFNWSPAPSISEHLACLWPLCLSLVQPLYRPRLLLSLICCTHCNVSIVFPASKVWLKVLVCWCLLLCSHCSCEFSPLNILYCPFVGYWKRYLPDLMRNKIIYLL